MPVSEESKTYHNNYLRVQCYITDRESAEIWRAIEKQLTEKNIEVFGKSEKITSLKVITFLLNHYSLNSSSGKTV
ncbi:MAG: hypothetical protein H7A25_18480 [Leptospiraceae bacterium]|nr:hypothetical protein [Leptospiraceae bacterium]MCP5501894.1 hypothetical protein [Leptospiraceae bacterium]